MEKERTKLIRGYFTVDNLFNSHKLKKKKLNLVNMAITERVFEKGDGRISFPVTVEHEGNSILVRLNLFQEKKEEKHAEIDKNIIRTIF